MALHPPPEKDDYRNEFVKGRFSYIWLRWFAQITNILNSNASETVTVVSSIQAGGGGGVGFQYKTRDLTVNKGIITTIGAEGSWNDI